MNSEPSLLVYIATGGLLIVTLLSFLVFTYFWFVSTSPGRRLPRPPFWTHALASGFCMFFLCSALSTLAAIWFQNYRLCAAGAVLGLVVALLAADAIASHRKLNDFLNDYLAKRGLLRPPTREGK